MIEINFEHAMTHYALYNLVTPSGELIHIGIAPFNQLTAIPDVPIHVRDMYGVAYLSVIMVDEDREKLANVALKTDVPELHERIVKQVKAWSIRTSKQAVECIETGETWDSAKACAEAHNLTYGALLQHLAGVKSFDTVKGKTYRKLRT